MRIRYEALTLKDGRDTVFTDLNVGIPTGQIACFYGPTRAGKTSLLLLTGGFLKPTGGRVWLDNRNIVQAPYLARQWTGLGIIAEFNPLLSNLTVAENLLFQSRIYKVATPHTRVQSLLAEFDLERAAHKQPDELSQPEHLRTGIAAALVHNPPVLLLDEPSHALTEHELAEQWTFLRQVQRLGTTILLASHSLWAATHADRTILMPSGREVHPDEFAAIGLA